MTGWSLTTRPTGKRSSTERQPSRRCTTFGLDLAVLAVVGVCLLLASPAAALDIFTLWRQPMIPLELTEGNWADYRLLTQTGGRWDEELLRVSCLRAEDDRSATNWLMEIVPIEVAADGTYVPIAGEGLRLRLSRDLLQRQGRLVDLVQQVEQWRDGAGRLVPAAEWRDDPLVASSFGREFAPDDIVGEGATVRVVGGQELTCDQFLLSAVDSQVVNLPAGRMVQVTRQEISVAVSTAIPFLGIAFAAERVRAESRLEPPSDRFDPPPPHTQIESMELLAFGDGAKPHLVR